MNKFIQIIVLILTLSACKEKVEVPNSDSAKAEIVRSPAALIAQRHGIENWGKVEQLKFTFNVDRGESGFSRSYIWNTRTDDITYMVDGDTLEYNRNDKLDSLSLKADQRFVNDSFWLLSPFKLVWDEGTRISEVVREIAPISGDTLNRISLVYGDFGGYTPGDAYDFYFTDDYLVKEWVYRRKNADSATLKTKWSDYSGLNGLQLATMHTDSAATWKLYFTDLMVN